MITFPQIGTGVQTFESPSGVAMIAAAVENMNKLYYANKQAYQELESPLANAKVRNVDQHIVESAQDQLDYDMKPIIEDDAFHKATSVVMDAAQSIKTNGMLNQALTDYNLELAANEKIRESNWSTDKQDLMIKYNSLRSTGVTQDKDGRIRSGFNAYNWEDAFTSEMINKVLGDLTKLSGYGINASSTTEFKSLMEMASELGISINDEIVDPTTGLVKITNKYEGLDGQTISDAITESLMSNEQYVNTLRQGAMLTDFEKRLTNADRLGLEVNSLSDLPKYNLSDVYSLGTTSITELSDIKSTASKMGVEVTPEFISNYYNTAISNLISNGISEEDAIDSIYKNAISADYIQSSINGIATPIVNRLAYQVKDVNYDLEWMKSITNNGSNSDKQPDKPISAISKSEDFAIMPDQLNYQDRADRVYNNVRDAESAYMTASHNVVSDENKAFGNILKQIGYKIQPFSATNILSNSIALDDLKSMFESTIGYYKKGDIASIQSILDSYNSKRPNSDKAVTMNDVNTFISSIDINADELTYNRSSFATQDDYDRYQANKSQYDYAQLQKANADTERQLLEAESIDVINNQFDRWMGDTNISWITGIIDANENDMIRVAREEGILDLMEKDYKMYDIYGNSTNLEDVKINGLVYANDIIHFLQEHRNDPNVIDRYNRFKARGGEFIQMDDAMENYKNDTDRTPNAATSASMYINTEGTNTHRDIQAKIFGGSGTMKVIAKSHDDFETYQLGLNANQDDVAIIGDNDFIPEAKIQLGIMDNKVIAKVYNSVSNRWVIYDAGLTPAQTEAFVDDLAKSSMAKSNKAIAREMILPATKAMMYNDRIVINGESTDVHTIGSMDYMISNPSEITKNGAFTIEVANPIIRDEQIPMQIKANNHGRYTNTFTIQTDKIEVIDNVGYLNGKPVTTEAELEQFQIAAMYQDINRELSTTSNGSPRFHNSFGEYMAEVSYLLSSKTTQ